MVRETLGRAFSRVELPVPRSGRPCLDPGLLGLPRHSIVTACTAPSAKSTREICHEAYRGSPSKRDFDLLQGMVYSFKHEFWGRYFVLNGTDFESRIGSRPAQIG